MKVSIDARLRITGLILLLVNAAFSWAGSASFEDGVRLFSEGRYEQALASFMKARERGRGDARLDYNLGSTYYRLGRFDEAERAFLRAARSAEYAPLAHYNLGLVAAHQERTSQADAWFRKALGETGDPRIRRLCRTALERLAGGDTGPDARAPSWSGFANIDIGYDDNVTLQPDTLILSTSRKDDFFVDAYALASRRLSGDETRGWRIEGRLFAQKYVHLSRFDTLSLGLGARLDHAYGPSFAGRSGLRSELTLLDNRGFTTTTTLSTQGTRGIARDGRLRLRYELAYIDALDPQYAYLTGWRQRFDIRPRWHWGRDYRLTLGYRYELNDRKDRRTPRFTSFSARRHRLRLDGSMRLARRVDLTATVTYRESRYRDPNRTVTGGEITRSEDRLRLRLMVSRELGKGREVSLGLQHTRNDSNIASYAYENNELVLGLLFPW